MVVSTDIAVDDALPCIVIVIVMEWNVTLPFLPSRAQHVTGQYGFKNSFKNLLTNQGFIKSDTKTME